MYDYKKLLNGVLNYQNPNQESFGFTESSLKFYYHAMIRCAKEHNEEMYHYRQITAEILKTLWEFDIINYNVMEENDKIRKFTMMIYDRTFKSPWEE